MSNKMSDKLPPSLKEMRQDLLELIKVMLDLTQAGHNEQVVFKRLKIKYKEHPELGNRNALISTIKHRIAEEVIK